LLVIHVIDAVMISFSLKEGGNTNLTALREVLY